MRRIVAITILLTTAALGQRAPRAQIRAGTSAWRPAPPVIVAQSNLVPVEVVVRGRGGQIVAGLGRNRFRIYDDGHARPLSQFFVKRARKAVSEPKAAPAAGLARSAGQGAGAAPPARYVALWIDDVDTQGRDLEHARNAALDFRKSGFGSDERVGLFTASGTQQVAFTQNVGALERGLAGVRAHPRENEYGLQESCPRITPYQAYQIIVLNYKEAFQAALAEKQACAGQPVNDLTGKPIASLEPSVNEPILAQAMATWEQARAFGQDAQAGIAAVVADLAQPAGATDSADCLGRVLFRDAGRRAGADCGRRAAASRSHQRARCEGAIYGIARASAG